MIALIEGEENNATGNERLYFDEMEKTAANASGMSYEEYLWIKDTVITTQTKLWLKQYYEANNKIVNLLDRTLTQHKPATQDSKDKDEQELMDAYVQEMKRELAGLQARINRQDKYSDSFNHNSAIIIKFAQALDAVEKQPE